MGLDGGGHTNPSCPTCGPDMYATINPRKVLSATEANRDDVVIGCRRNHAHI